MLTYQSIKENTKEEILSYGLVGIEFEFYSNLSPEKTGKAFEKLTDKKIRVEDEAHSDFVPTDKEWKLEKDMSGGAGLLELVTGPVKYKSSRKVIIDVLKWIEENGYTTSKCSIHLNVSFDTELTQKPGLISQMDPLKFVLNFNEGEVYKLFPNRKNSVYAKSIKWIMPRTEANYFNGQHVNPHIFDFGKEKYYGVNFEKLQKGYLEFRYLGGKDYEKKTSNILYLLDRFFVQLWYAANEEEYTDLNLVELKKILARNFKFVEILKDWRNIKKHFKDIDLFVDLKNNEKIIDLQWPKIKQGVVRLLTHGGLESGVINYDSDIGRVQVKEGELLLCFNLENYDFIDCKVGGLLSFCDFFRSQLESTYLTRCNLYQGTSAIDSKIDACYINHSVEVKNSYVMAWDSVFKGKMIGGIFRHGKIGKEATFDNVEIVQSKKIK
jgi:hypothetical protein